MTRGRIHLATIAALRTLQEAGGICNRCAARRLGKMAADESPKDSGRFVACCINRTTCRRRVREARRRLSRGDG